MQSMKPYHRNPRQISKKEFADLKASLEKLGDLGGIVHNIRTDEIIGGNQRENVFGEAQEIQITETYEKPDRQGTIALGFVIWKGTKYAYRQVDWDEPTAAEANIRANLTGGKWDFEVFANQWDTAELMEWGFDADLQHTWGRDYSALTLMLASEAEDNDFAGNDDGDETDAEQPLFSGVPDAIWPSDNKFGIPMLSIDRQADALEIPFEIWGAKKRGTSCGTLGFYTEDYRFATLWSKPDSILTAGASSFIEPNFSIYQDFPLAVALWRTYQKRWLARYWQSQGLRCFVDLNVNANYYEVNMLGVPKGWKAYATRGYADRLEYTEQELSIAREHAGTGDILFVVYGGGKRVKEWGENNGVIWISEDMDRAKGLYTEAIGELVDIVI